MLDTAIRTQLAAYLERLQRPIELIATLDESAKSQEIRELLEEIASLSPKVSARFDGQDARVPSFAIAQPGEAARIHFAGIPMGHEFTSLVLALLHTGGHPPKTEPEVLAQIRAIQGEFRFETFISLSCHNCPDVVQALNLMAVQNPGVTHTMIDGALFQQEVENRQVMAVPMVFLNGQLFGQGRMTLEEVVAKLDTGAAAREAEKIAAKEVFDVLVVGGGPAGAAAAIYAARKGLKTGIVAERFGGQILDTLAIENFISVPETEGPKLAANLEAHVRSYPVDIMNLQTAQKLTQENGITTIHLASGASLKARSVVLALGARWRNMDVPGEKEYRARGVAYCPHCDGPLYKGKRVAVFGGGNSGVEAAIDLSGIVSHVTLLARSQVRADAALQRKLESIANITVIPDTLPAEVLGDGQKVTGLAWNDKETGVSHRLDLEGIFVQIGLIPNTEWLRDSGLALAKNGEIETDVRGQTSLPGVFAAGDCTTVPYKQIIVAMGEGAKASLSAFDYLIRSGQ